MNWNGAGNFFAMGGYGLYVWGSYAIVAVWMLAEPWMVWRKHRAAFNNILQDQEQGISDETAS
ncbi:MAG: heme exporter protein CcmD [Burkholderiales bacterium]|nr:heme exporter protein CcmD [Burkholderiales bacterium]